MALVKCKECEKEISDKAEVCVHCGIEQKKKKVSEREVVNEVYQINTVPKKSGFIKNNIIPVILIFMGAILLIIGLSNDYYSYSDPDAYDTHVYPREKYINGDAYNYIINAGYATAFFVLAIGAALLGVGFLIVYYLSNKKVD